jgi:hypothetical protein
MPAVAGMLRRGDRDGAVLATGNDEMPEPSRADDFVLDAWKRLRGEGSDMLFGNGWGYFATRCEPFGLGAAERIELWERVLTVDAMMAEYSAAMSARVH